MCIFIFISARATITYGSYAWRFGTEDAKVIVAWVIAHFYLSCIIILSFCNLVTFCDSHSVVRHRRSVCLSIPQFAYPV